MDNFKQNQNWGDVFLAYQNDVEHRSFCDFKLICSDGYVLIHKALLTEKLNCELVSCSEKILPTNVTLSQVSKLVLLIYTGEIIINNKAELQALKPLFEAFQMERLKRFPFPRKVIKTRRGGTTIATGQIGGSSSLDPNKLKDRKVRAVKFINDIVEEQVLIFGDGTTMTLPPPEARSNDSCFVYYDEFGRLVTEDEEEKSFCCNPCSLIFCDSNDFMEHSSSCCNQRAPQPPPTVMKIETDFIKVESTTELITEEYEGTEEKLPRIVGTITVCLICVTSCKDVSELIVHSNEKHNISPDKDYDIGTWKCKRCKSLGSSNELSVFLQHIYRCRREKRKRNECGQNNSMMDNQSMKRRRTNSHEKETASVSRNCKDAAVSLCPIVTNSRAVDGFSTLEAIEAVENQNPVLKASKQPDAAVCTLSPLNSFKIPKMSTNPVLKSPVITAVHGRHDLLDTSETLLRSPKALSTLNDNKQHESSNQLLVSKNTASFSSTNSMFTFQRTAARVSSTSKKTKNKANVEGFSAIWLKKKDKTQCTVAADPVSKSSMWSCCRCKKYFPSQNVYMGHNCKQIVMPPSDAFSVKN